MANVRGITREAIEAEYPEPRSADNRQDGFGLYCVGGALCSYLWDHYKEDQLPEEYLNPWPQNDDLAEVLAWANPYLAEADGPKHYAFDYAERITTHNDEEHFQTAWKLLEEALDWAPEKGRVK